MLNQPMLPGLDAHISSAELADGPKPCVSRTGPNGSHAGLARHLVNRLAQPESNSDATTPATSAPDLSIWSGPAAPLCCSGSKSPARMLSDALQSRANKAVETRLRGLGGTRYRFAWKRQVTPHGRRLFLLRASGLRTSAKGCSSPPSIFDLPQAQACRDQIAGFLTGWATASARDWKDTGGMAATGTNPDGSVRSRMDQLGRQAHLSTWPTSTAMDGNRIPSPDFTTANITLNHAAVLTGWPTSRAADGEKNVRTAAGAASEIARKGGPQDLAMGATLTGWPTTSTNNDRSPRDVVMMREDGSKNQQRLQDFAAIAGPARLTASGHLLTGSTAQMEAGGQLSPAHSRWLMGYPETWCKAALSCPLLTRSRKTKRGA